MLALLVVAAIVGLYGRFDQLGMRQLAQDEFFFVWSIRSILDHGLPVMYGGGYYVRGLLPQYVTAATVAVLGDSGLAFRLPSVLFNVGTVVAAYVYARLFLPRTAALAIPAILLLSSWEVEFARFARMYSAFQFTTILLLIVVVRTLRGWSGGRRLLPLVVLLNLLSHGLGLLFVPALVLPPLVAWWRDRRLAASEWAAYVIGAGAVALVGAGFFLIPFRHLNVSNRLPADMPVWQGGGLFRQPSTQTPDFLILAIGTIALVAIVRLGWRIKNRDATAAPIEALAWIALASAVCHALLVWVAALSVLGLRYGLSSLDRKAVRVLAAASVVLASAWLLYFVGVVGLDGSSLVRKVAGWPNFIDPIVRPWRNEMPLLGIMLLAATAISLAQDAREPRLRLLASPAAFIAYILLAFSVLDSRYVSTRYVFFLYPVALVVLTLVAWRFTRWIGRNGMSSLIVLPLFMLSEDFNPGHLLNVPSLEASFRIAQYERYAPTWYIRHDFAGVASYLNQTIPRFLSASGGRPPPVIVFPPSGGRAYLNYPNALYISRENPEFSGQSRDRGTRDIWLGQRLISTPEELRTYAGDAPVIFLVKRADLPLGIPVDSAWPDQAIQAESVYVSRDGRLEVMRVDRGRYEEPSSDGG